MKFVKCVGLPLLAILAVALLLKIAQEICWKTKLIPPPSLDSWDPTERFEAARHAAKKYGGKP